MPDIAVIPREILSTSRESHPCSGTYFVHTWGCQMNEEDSEQIGLALEGAGFRKSARLQEADVILLNTCSVRKKPEDKAFSLLGELQPLKESNPEKIIGVCGCMAQIRADEIRRRAPHVDFVLGTGDIAKVAGLVSDAMASRGFRKELRLPERKGAVVTEIPQRETGRTPKLKAFLPIQYGCDKFCAFCIVPSTRGRERSRPTAHILEEATSLAQSGTREITLLGQTVNSYGKNLAGGKVPFSRLLWMLAEIPGLERIRFTSPYPRDFTPDLLEAVRDCRPVMEHVHLPLQSGNDEVLKRMRRLYTRASFLEIVAALRRTVPGIAITTDIIVGFPGETDKQFEETISLVEEVRFDGAFMFIYSPRPETPAAEMEQVPFPVRQERMKRLVELQNSISCEINESYVGKNLEVLVEGASPKNPQMLQGYSREFKMMHFEGDPSLAGQLVKVEATSAHLWGLRGRISG